jgi:hypothetical protein
MRSILFLILFIYASVYPQETDSVEYIQSIVEERLHSEESEEDSYLSEYIDELIENPVNINTAGAAGLSTLPFLSSSDIQKILEHRNRYGPFFSKHELYVIKGITENRIRDILPFIKLFELNESNSIKEIFLSPKISLRSRFRKSNLDDKTGYTWGNFNRVRIDMNKKITIGLITEKDEGEKQFNDLTTAYVKINELFLINKLIIGDYKIESGQGLLLWGSYGMPKNADVINSAYKKARGILPNSGSSEMSFFRGIAYEHSYKNFILRGFLSGRHRDAVIDSSGIDRLLKDGYHRTNLELSRKNSIYERLIGGILGYSSELFEAALTGISTNFDKDLFNGSNKAGGLSLSTRFIFDDLLFFGEAARMENSNAVLAGFNINPVKSIEFTSVFRRYEPEYLNLYGFGFGERMGATNNETGIYSGISLHTNIGVFSFYLDQYSFLISSEGIHNTLHGHDLLFYAGIPLDKKMTLNIRYKLENKDDLIPSSARYRIGKRLKQSVKGEITYRVNSFSIKSRCEYTSYLREGPAEEGYMFMNEIKYSIFKEAGIILRAAFYTTSSFQSAIYTYETGIPGMLENKVLSGDGFRLYSVIKISPENFPALYIKYSGTIKENLNNSSIMIQMEMNY